VSNVVSLICIITQSGNILPVRRVMTPRVLRVARFVERGVDETCDVDSLIGIIAQRGDLSVVRRVVTPRVLRVARCFVVATVEIVVIVDVLRIYVYIR